MAQRLSRDQQSGHQDTAGRRASIRGLRTTLLMLTLHESGAEMAQRGGSMKDDNTPGGLLAPAHMAPQAPENTKPLCSQSQR